MTCDAKLQAAVQSFLDQETDAITTKSIIVVIAGYQEERDRHIVTQKRRERIVIRLRGEEAIRFLHTPSYELLGEAYGVDEEFFLGSEYGENTVDVETITLLSGVVNERP